MNFPKKQRRMLQISSLYGTIFLSLIVASLWFPSFYWYLIAFLGIVAVWLLIEEKVKRVKAQHSL